MAIRAQPDGQGKEAVGLVVGPDHKLAARLGERTTGAKPNPKGLDLAREAEAVAAAWLDEATVAPLARVVDQSQRRPGRHRRPPGA